MNYSNFVLTFTVSPVYSMHMILKDWFGLWTKVSGIRYVEPAVYDHWPFNRLGSLKPLKDPPADLFLMRSDFSPSPSPSKPPFFIFSLLCGWKPSDAGTSLKSLHQVNQENTALINPETYCIYCSDISVF